MSRPDNIKWEDRVVSPEEALAHIDQLEERIKVLERIVTENKFDLGREIDRLR